MVPTIVVPVMTLGRCVFLPQQLMPLRIFEARYRRMLKETLAGSRMFAISQHDESAPGADETETPSPFTCVGRIVGHVEMEDGTSHIVLEGLRRARVIRVKRRTPYPCLEIAPVVDEPVGADVNCAREIARVLAYAEKIIEELGESGEPLMNRLRGLANQPGALADAAAGHLVEEVEIRRLLLECLSQEQRLKSVADELARVEARRQLEAGDEDSRALN